MKRHKVVTSEARRLFPEMDETIVGTLCTYTHEGMARLSGLGLIAAR